jgi:hypothetical protein
MTFQFSVTIDVRDTTLVDMRCVPYRVSLNEGEDSIPIYTTDTDNLSSALAGVLIKINHEVVRNVRRSYAFEKREGV